MEVPNQTRTRLEQLYHMGFNSPSTINKGLPPHIENFGASIIKTFSAPSKNTWVSIFLFYVYEYNMYA